MNTVTAPLQHAEDYRTSMQRAARGFIERHQAEHLNDDGLFDRTVRYLVASLDVPAFMADRLVHLAMSERLQKGDSLLLVDMSRCDAGTRMVLDRRTGLRRPIPLRFLPDRFRAAQDTH